MATKQFRQPARTETKRVWQGTIASTTDTHTFVVTITDDNGDTAAIQATANGVLTASQIAAAFVASWNSSLNPLVSSVVASAVGAVITLTARTAGVPFSVAASGTGTWSGTGLTSSGVSNTDYGQGANWSGDAVPTTGDDVTLQEGRVGLLYGLNQSTVEIDEFVIERNCSSRVGRWQDGTLHYLRIAPNSFDIRGSGSLIALDFGSENISGYVEGYGSPTQAGLAAIYLKGSNLATVEIVRGNVAIAPMVGDVTTIADLLVGCVEGQSDATVTVGAGVSLTNLNQSSGRCLLRCAAASAVVSRGAELTTEGAGGITTMTVYGNAYPKSSGTIGTLNVHGLVDFSRDRTPRTITTLVEHPGGVLLIHSGITITNRTKLAAPGEFRLIYV